MATHEATRSDDEHRELLGRLFRARGIERYGLYLLTGEHEVTPSGYEEMSGYVIQPDGRAHFFWSGWADATRTDALTTWREVIPDADWQGDEEYQEALADARGHACVARPASSTSTEQGERRTG